MHEELVMEVLHGDPATANRREDLLRGLGHEVHTIEKPSASGEPDALFAELSQVAQAQALRSTRVVVGIAPAAAAADDLLCHEITDWIARPFEPAAVASAVLRVLLLRRKSVGDATRAQRSSEQYDQLRQEHDLFAGRISHDLAGILRNIDGFASAFEQRWGQGSTSRRGITSRGSDRTPPAAPTSFATCRGTSSCPRPACGRWRSTLTGSCSGPGPAQWPAATRPASTGASGDRSPASRATPFCWNRPSPNCSRTPSSSRAQVAHRPSTYTRIAGTARWS